MASTCSAAAKGAGDGYCNRDILDADAGGFSMNPVFAAAATFWVAIGGALGSVARYWMAVAVARLAGEWFPWGTLLINIIGSFMISYFGTMTLPDGARPASMELRLFVMVGLCGGFTTFSSFSMQTIELLR